MFNTNPEFNFPLFTFFKISRPYEEKFVLGAGVGCYHRHRRSVNWVAVLVFSQGVFPLQFAQSKLSFLVCENIPLLNMVVFNNELM